MTKPIQLNKLCARWFVADMLEAIRRHDLITPGSTVAVALSGDRNSTALLYMLNYLNLYSQLNCRLSAVHIRFPRDPDTSKLRRYCHELEIEYVERHVDASDSAPGSLSPTRTVRTAMVEALIGRGIDTVAFAHSADDVVEAFFVNLARNKRLGSLAPKVDLHDGTPVVIRPMIYLSQRVIQKVHAHFRLPLLDCGAAPVEDELRKAFRAKASQIEGRFSIKAFARSVVDALEHIEESDIWSAC